MSLSTDEDYDMQEPSQNSIELTADEYQEKLGQFDDECITTKTSYLNNYILTSTYVYDHACKNNLVLILFKEEVGDDVLYWEEMA